MSHVSLSAESSACSSPPVPFIGNWFLSFLVPGHIARICTAAETPCSRSMPKHPLKFSTLRSTGKDVDATSSFLQLIMCVRRDIVVGAENPRTGKTIAEKARQALLWLEWAVYKHSHVPFACPSSFLNLQGPQVHGRQTDAKGPWAKGWDEFAKGAYDAHEFAKLRPSDTEDMQINKLLMKNQAYKVAIKKALWERPWTA